MSDINELNTSLGSIQIQLEKLKTATDHIAVSKDAATEATEAAIEFKNTVQKFIGPVQNLVKDLEKIDFPSRLDKIDLKISAVNLGLQNTQNRIDSLERALRDEIGQLKNALQHFDKQNLKRDGQIKKFLYLLLVAILSLGGIIIFLLMH